MAGEVPFRDIVEYAIGGGWGEESPTAGYVPVRVIRGTDFSRIRSGTLDEVPARYEEAGKADRRRLADSDLVLEISGGSRTSKQSTGRSFLIRQRILDALGPHVIPASFCRLLRVKRAIADPQYAYYALQDMYTSGRAANYEQQSTGISNFQFEYFLDEETVRLPPLPEQKRIAHILGTLDDKIELNRRMNATLEGISRALFKSWFVDFDPVRQKAAGKQPVGMDAETASLFPDSFEDSEIGEVPRGWGVVPLPEIVEVNPARPLRKGETARYLDMANMPTTGHTPDELVARPFGSGTRFTNGDTLVARITPCLENGKTAFIDCLEQDEVAWGSTEFIVLRPRPPQPPEYAYCLARDEGFREFAIQSMTGSSGRQRVPAESLSHFLLAHAPEELMVAFGDWVQPHFRSIRAAANESRTLAALRDTLLPKLLSGEIRVPEAEEAVEEAIA